MLTNGAAAMNGRGDDEWNDNEDDEDDVAINDGDEICEID